ncbi:hypothetical protein [Streptomyces shenzhenensis]|nr:hypothetical protein [Streptomyces shenzhenensis]
MKLPRLGPRGSEIPVVADDGETRLAPRPHTSGTGPSSGTGTARQTFEAA